jgi:hypothetical protein
MHARSANAFTVTFLVVKQLANNRLTRWVATVRSTRVVPCAAHARNQRVLRLGAARFSTSTLRCLVIDRLARRESEIAVAILRSTRPGMQVRVDAGLLGMLQLVLAARFPLAANDAGQIAPL